MLKNKFLKLEATDKKESRKTIAGIESLLTIHEK